MKLAINLVLVSFAPLILYWQYHDVQLDLKKLEAKQEAKFNALEIPTRSAPSFRIEPPVPQVQVPVAPTPKLQVIKTSNTIRYTDRDLFCMAKNIYHEAAHEPILGRYAVAQITLNRKYNPKYPKNICDVILDPFQFSWANDRKLHWVQPRGPAWEESRKIAEDVIIRGYRVKGLEHGLFYHATYVSPKWKDNSARITQIGQHIFYHRAL